MAGGKTISENYAFAGMHHIFDQHTAAGITWLYINSSIKAFCCQHPVPNHKHVGHNFWNFISIFLFF